MTSNNQVSAAQQLLPSVRDSLGTPQVLGWVVQSIIIAFQLRLNSYIRNSGCLQYKCLTTVPARRIAVRGIRYLQLLGHPGPVQLVSPRWIPSFMAAMWIQWMWLRESRWLGSSTHRIRWPISRSTLGRCDCTRDRWLLSRSTAFWDPDREPQHTWINSRGPKRSSFWLNGH